MSSHPKSVRVREVSLYFIPVVMRVPLKFGNQVLESVTCARAKITVEDASGKTAVGWGETPLSVGWVWPSDIDYENRHTAMKDFTIAIADAFQNGPESGHPIEIGYDFIEKRLHPLQDSFNENRDAGAALPHLAALVCFSLFDIAVHDAYGNLHECPVYDTYNADFMSRDLSDFITPDSDDVNFDGLYPDAFLSAKPELKLPVWHLVGGLDPISEEELTGDEPDDGYPVLLRQWIREDGLDCLKIKLRGNDAEWDYDRLQKIGQISQEENVTWLTTDFNCTVTDPSYVNNILDRLKDEDPVTYQKILYVEQPFPHDLEANRIDVHSVSARKPLFMDESAHDWRFVKMGRELGWTGVALKTCKTQTGALLSLCWAKAHGMTLMVQDLTNPMLAQVPHFLLAAHAETIMGVESNGMQFYPEASTPELAIHPGLYKRQEGILDGSTLSDHGFGYRVDEITRELPAPVFGS
ncbi:enolase C-terminal domain-like protein [Verrucomicrobiales bacterium BCK34]|nr:enolase C-terminal domain-like protein [Verrucomicrobiales bacterium BCK34]